MEKVLSRKVWKERYEEVPPPLSPARRHRSPVVYVPGFLRLNVSSTTLRRRLKNLDFEVYMVRIPRLSTGDIRWGARLLAERMEELRILLGARSLAVLGQGMGGLVARWAAEKMGCHQWLSRLVMLGTPNGGSFLLYLFLPCKAARQALPEGSLLEGLNREYKRLKDERELPYVSVYTPWDAVVVPWTRCRLEGAENLRVGWFCTHAGLVRSRAVMAVLADILEEKAEHGEDAERAREDEGLLQELNRVLAGDPDDETALLRRARLFYDWGYYRLAIQDLNRLLRMRQDLPEAYMLRGGAYRRKIQYDDNPLYNRAIRDFSQVIRIKPGNAEAYYERGVCYALLNAWEEALDDWDRALILNRDLFPAYLARGLGRKRKGDIRGAVEDFTEVLRINPDEPDALRLLSEMGA